MAQPVDLPHFPYHRDPVASGSVEFCDTICECCGAARGAVYLDNIYTAAAVQSLCPWCIADGSAAQKYNATFIDGWFCDDNLDPVELAAEYHHAVFGRTIGVATYNPIGWWVHCGEPAEYVTREEPYDMLFQCRRCGKKHVVQDLD